MYGAVGLERYEGKKWHHSRESFRILNKHCIGDLLQNAKPDSSVLHHVNMLVPTASLPNDLWTVLGHSKITDTTSLIQLKAA